MYSPSTRRRLGRPAWLGCAWPFRRPCTAALPPPRGLAAAAAAGGGGEVRTGLTHALALAPVTAGRLRLGLGEDQHRGVAIAAAADGAADVAVADAGRHGQRAQVLVPTRGKTATRGGRWAHSSSPCPARGHCAAVAAVAAACRLLLEPQRPWLIAGWREAYARRPLVHHGDLRVHFQLQQVVTQARRRSTRGRCRARWSLGRRADRRTMTMAANCRVRAPMTDCSTRSPAAARSAPEPPSTLACVTSSAACLQYEKVCVFGRRAESRSCADAQKSIVSKRLYIDNGRGRTTLCFLGLWGNAAPHTARSSTGRAASCPMWSSRARTVARPASRPGLSIRRYARKAARVARAALFVTRGSSLCLP